LLPGLRHVCDELIAFRRRGRRFICKNRSDVLAIDPRRYERPALLQMGLNVLKDRHHPGGRHLLGDPFQGFVQKRSGRQIAIGQCDRRT
jgi:hypothetical protein